MNCMASVTGAGSLRHFNPQVQYPLSLDLMQALFAHRLGYYPSAADFTNEPTGGELQLSPHVNNIISQDLALNSARSNRESQIITNELQKAVIAGQYRFQSLRAVAAQAQSKGRIKAKKRKSMRNVSSSQSSERDHTKNQASPGVDDDNMIDKIF